MVQSQLVTEALVEQARKKEMREKKRKKKEKSSRKSFANLKCPPNGEHRQGQQRKSEGSPDDAGQ